MAFYSRIHSLHICDSGTSINGLGKRSQMVSTTKPHPQCTNIENMEHILITF